MLPKQFDKTSAAANFCAEAQEQFFYRVEGLLSLKQEATLQAHLDSCERCRYQWNQYRLLESQLCLAHEAIPAPGDLSAGFYQKLAQERKVSTPRLRWFITLPTFATAIVAIVLFQTVNHQANPITPMPLRSEKGVSVLSKNVAPSFVSGSEIANMPTQSSASEQHRSVSLKGGGHRALSRHKHAIVSLATTVTLPMTAKQPVVLAMLNDQRPPLEGVDLEVTDNERGFESKVHIGGEDLGNHGTRVVTINDEEPSTMPTFAVEQSQE
ncbi:MAG: zf-HC2 domain-containing protein [Armatimonadetes bacterium]|nr:zf-HC2 domain-containing protein [Armatimonadota bacterium]